MKFIKVSKEQLEKDFGAESEIDYSMLFPPEKKGNGYKIKLPQDKLELGDDRARVYTGFKPVFDDGEIICIDAQFKLKDGTLISCKPNIAKSYFNSDNEGHLYVEIKRIDKQGKTTTLRHGEQIAFMTVLTPKKTVPAKQKPQSKK